MGEWIVDSSWKGDPEEEDKRLTMIPSNVLTKYRMKRDTGQGLLGLWLTNQRIGILASQIGQLLNLRTLGLENNRIMVLPAEIGNLKRLERLMLSGNNLVDLPESVSEMKSLRFLTLSRNNFVTFPEQVINLRRLNHLSLGNNAISVIPSSIAHLRLLMELEIENNLFTDETLSSVPWNNCSKDMIFINISGNRGVTQVPPGMLSLPSLEGIKLGNTLINFT